MRKLGQLLLSRLTLERVTLNRLTIKSKLQLLLLAVSLVSILVIGYISWSRAQVAFQGAIVTQLTSVRASKATQIESYFKNLRNQVETLCEDRMVVAAMDEFNKGFKQLNRVWSQSVSGENRGTQADPNAGILAKNSSLSPVSPEPPQSQATADDHSQLKQEYIPADLNSTLEEYYNKEFFPRLSKKIAGVPTFETYRPTSQAGQYLQYYYIAKNPNPIGKKDELVNAGDKSEYSQAHEKYHPILRNLIKKFGYYDLFLIDYKTGDVVYTVYKETDFGTNLGEEPYRKTNLAEAFEAVQENPERGAIQLIDFKPYRPSYMAPVAFLAGPIYNGSQIVGILALQLPVDEINRVLTSNQNWEQDGLGKTGDTYLVGSDLLMRSVSRYLIENKKDYLASLRATGTPENNIQLIDQLNTSILLQKVDTEATRAAIEGATATKIVKDYRGGSVFSSYSPVHIKGVNWGIVAKKDVSEAFKPLYTLQNYIIISAVILILLLTFAASPLIYRFVEPINAMIEGSRKAGAGELDVEVKLNSYDEFGELAKLLNELIKRLCKQQELIEQKNQENEVLLVNILPKPVAERVKKGEEQIADDIQQVTVLFATLIGFSELAAQSPVQEAANRLNELIDSFDEEAEKHDVEKIKTIGQSYMAACGLTMPRLDHTKRMMDFALQALEIVQGFNNTHSTKLSLGIGIHTGAVTAGIVGSQKFTYEVWGKTVNIAAKLNIKAEPNTILVTQEVYDRVSDLHTFEKGKELELETRAKLITWVLRKQWVQNLFAEFSFGGIDDFDDMDDEDATDDDIKPIGKASIDDTDEKEATDYEIKPIAEESIDDTDEKEASDYDIKPIAEESIEDIDEKETSDNNIKNLIGEEYDIKFIGEESDDYDI